jgi:lysophospholipase L1-like esterase
MGRRPGRLVPAWVMIGLLAMPLAAMAKPGNLNPGQDADVDLADAIIGLKVLSGVPVTEVSAAGDVDGDERIGLPEVVFILQTVAGIRTYNQLPAANIVSIVPADSGEADVISTRQPIAFTGSGVDPDGSVVGFRWESNIDGILGEEAVLSQKILSAGNHTISLYVTDDDEAESEAATQTIAVKHLLVAIGDSITEGYGVAPEDGFPSKLEGLLGGDYRVVNKGKAGEESSYGAQQIDGWLSDYPWAERFLVMFGTNDSNPNRTDSEGLFLGPRDSGLGTVPNDAPDWDSGTLKDMLYMIVHSIQSANVNVAVAKIPIALGNSRTSNRYDEPVDSRPRNETIQEYNQVVAELVAENGIATVPPDFFAKFYEIVPAYGDARRYTVEFPEDDNLHPNEIGYETMANVWLEKLNK